MMLRLIALTFALLLPLLAHAEVEKVATPCESGTCSHWWPKLPEIKGWHHDRGSSIRFDLNAQTRDTATFADAETVIYAQAPHKPRFSALKSLQEFIENDQLDFAQLDPEMKIEEVEPLVTADGQKLRCFIFAPSGDGNWKLVSYGEEGEFYLVFTLSSRTQPGLLKARSDYEKLVTRYKSSP